MIFQSFFDQKFEGASQDELTHRSGIELSTAPSIPRASFPAHSMMGPSAPSSAGANPCQIHGPSAPPKLQRGLDPMVPLDV